MLVAGCTPWGEEEGEEEESGRFEYPHSRFASAVEVLIMELLPLACLVCTERVRAM